MGIWLVLLQSFLNGMSYDSFNFKTLWLTANSCLLLLVVFLKWKLKSSALVEHLSSRVALHNQMTFMCFYYIFYIKFPKNFFWWFCTENFVETFDGHFENKLMGWQVCPYKMKILIFNLSQTELKVSQLI